MDFTRSGRCAVLLFAAALLMACPKEDPAGHHVSGSFTGTIEGVSDVHGFLEGAASERATR